MEDTALQLKQEFDSGQITTYQQASGLLESSMLLRKLLSKDFEPDTLNLLNRLTEICEIPFVGQIEQVQQWCKALVESSFCGDGFSLNKKSDYILSCYNSMITSILIRLNYPDKELIHKGIEWILNYQNVCRNSKNTWSGSGILKYGGCMKSTPCYIGVVKAMIALSDYKKQDYAIVDEALNNKLKAGLEYILEHHLFKRLSNGEPITKDITKISYPFSYKTNIIEILRLLNDNSLSDDARCDEAKAYLLSRKKTTEHWQVNSSYLPKAWVMFDSPKKQGAWVTYEILKLRL